MMDSTLELMKSDKAKRVTDNCEFREGFRVRSNW